MAIVTKPCKHGTFSFLDNDKWIGKALAQTGEYSEAEVQKLLSLLDDDCVVVAVGAHWGSIAVPLAKAVGKLYAFEPQIAIYNLLCKNIEANTDHALPIPLVVGAKPGFASMNDVDLDADDINSGSVIVSGSGSDIGVTTLDLYCRDFRRLDLITIDVEGSESDVIAGAVQIIGKFRPLLYVENDRADKSKTLIEHISALGYQPYWHFPPLYNPDPFGAAHCVSINMLCLPVEHHGGDATIGCVPIMSSDDDWRLAYSRQQQEKNRQPDIVPIPLGESQPVATRPVAVKRRQWACVVRLGGVGDNLIASSVLPFLKQKYGLLEVISAEPQHVVFENNPYVDKLSVKKPGEPPWGDGKSWQAYWTDRASEYAFFAQLSHSLEGLRAFNDTQTAFYWSPQTRRKLAGQPYLETVADICGVPYERLAPDFFPTPSEDADALRIKRLNGRYAAWIISGTRVDKIWPPAAVAIARIIKELNLPVVLFGMPGKDFEIAKEIEKAVRVYNGSTSGLYLALSTSLDHPNWPLRRVLTQVQHADIVVSPDTGPAWAVAMHDMPKIVMVSHASAANITAHWRNTITLHADPARVPCWPCHQLHDTKESCIAEQRRCGLHLPDDAPGAACIADISVDRLIEAIRGSVGQQQLALAAE